MIKIPKSEEEWKKKLTPEQYNVLRKKGTEMAFTGKYDQHWEQGEYVCAGCGAKLFASDKKYNAGCGWPSFTAAESGAVDKQQDNSHGLQRVEVLCKKCKGHLGHVFDDGPMPAGKRFCINSAALKFRKK